MQRIVIYDVFYFMRPILTLNHFQIQNVHCTTIFEILQQKLFVIKFCLFSLIITYNYIYIIVRPIRII